MPPDQKEDIFETAAALAAVIELRTDAEDAAPEAKYDPKINSKTYSKMSPNENLKMPACATGVDRHRIG